jgi:ribosomal 50S subunit-associated protein YjgA (DUF615 family)
MEPNEKIAAVEVAVAVLKTEVKNIDEKLDDLKGDVKSIHDCLDASRVESNTQHAHLLDKVTKLEQWRWTIIGAGIAIGYFLNHIALFKDVFMK